MKTGLQRDGAEDETNQLFAEQLITKALELGASKAGIANIEELKKMPSFVMMPQRKHIDRAGAVKNETGLPEGVVVWNPNMKSVLVIAYEHPDNDLYIDSWVDDKNPPGNMKLIRIINGVGGWLKQEYPGVEYKALGYHVERGGIWLKDAAVVAGLGVVGKNNLLVTPEYGPRVRLRAMVLSEDIESTGKLSWDPCEKCSQPCRRACPMQAFEKKVYSLDEFNEVTSLPGRDGLYSLITCDRQMALDIRNSRYGDFEIPGYGKAKKVTAYCRECEINCVVGREK